MNNQILSMIMNSNNPQQFAMNMLNDYAKNNPMMRNILNIVNSNNTQDIEKIARNLCKERGINADELISQLKSYRR